MPRATVQRPQGMTPTQARFFDLLSDGLPHSRQELHSCLWDEQSSMKVIKFHLWGLRKLLKPLGMAILCELIYKYAIRYRLVILLPSARNNPPLASKG